MTMKNSKNKLSIIDKQMLRCNNKEQLLYLFNTANKQRKDLELSVSAYQVQQQEDKEVIKDLKEVLKQNSLQHTVVLQELDKAESKLLRLEVLTLGFLGVLIVFLVGVVL